jgi:hypothetical protein
MTALTHHLERLRRFLDTIDPPPPCRDVRLVEMQSGEAEFRQDGLCTPSDYEARFDELLAAGYAWLNVSCYGVFGNFLVVGVEVPTSKRLLPGAPTPVNLSGPSRIVLDRGWKLVPKD